MNEAICAGVADFLDLLALAGTARTRFAVCHQFRWHPWVVFCREAIAAGELGRIDALELSAGMNLAGVVPRSELSEKGQSRRIRDVAAEFKVDAVMEGTLFRAGDVMRINLQLVEPQSVRHYWTGSFELNVKNVLAAQDSIVRTINTQLRGVLDGTARKSIAANSGTKP